MPSTPKAGARTRQVVDPLTDFLNSEAAGGLALLAASIAALVWANVAGASYVSFWEREVVVGTGPLAIQDDLQHWINDGLMAVFFFVVGLEIKRELVTGELRDRRTAALPIIAAVGGAILPVAIFLALTAGAGGAEGWGIPMATDIAFAIGVLRLLGDRIASGLKLLVLTIAIVDDIIAITVIALFYSSDLSVPWLLAAVGGLLAIWLLRRAGVTRVLVYVPVGVFVWVATYESGVHATIAGVAIGLLTPARPIAGRPVLEQLEHSLHPVTSFVIVPLFALANAGVALNAGTLGDAVASRIAWGIVAGLLVGKLVGVGSAAMLCLRLGIGALPPDVRTRQVWGAAALAGIGFTVSLFITQLAYSDAATMDIAKVGILAGSAASGLLGVTILLSAPTSIARSRIPRSPPRGRRSAGGAP